MKFPDRLEITLSLAIGSGTFAIPGGSVRRFDLDVRSWGFTADVTFVIRCDQAPDELVEPFTTKDVITATMKMKTVEAPLAGDFERTGPTPLTLIGMVTDKWVSETTSEKLASEPVVLRHYRIVFQDLAQVLWRQHFPSDLWADETMKTVIDAYKVGGITITYDLNALTRRRDIIHVGLGGPHDREASFYDFLMWWLDAQAAVWELDTSTNTYRIGASKTTTAARLPVVREDVARVDVVFPPTRRNSGRVMNAYSESPDKLPIPSTQAVTGIRRDVLDRTPLAQELGSRTILEATRLLDRDEGLEVTFQRFPIVTYRPNLVVKFEEGWSDQLRYVGRKYRVLELRVSGVAARSSAELDSDFGGPTVELDVEASSKLELASSPVAWLPTFVPPTYPSYVEGKIVSMGGGETDRTWLVVENEQTSLAYHQVNVPLWNQKILVPFEPNLMPGHFFFPAYKHQRVLLALDFDAAQIVGFLDWAANAKLPGESQGNQIVLGKSATDGVTIAHTYEDAKPKLLLTRTMANDSETLEISDGLLKIVVKEDQTAAPPTETYDVTLQVEAAKGQLTVQVQGGTDDLTGSFEDSMGGLNAKIESSAAEVDEALASMESALVGRVDVARAELEALGEAMEASVDALGGKVAAAKGEIASALGD